jgi:hypothetical protein
LRREREKEKDVSKTGATTTTTMVIIIIIIIIIFERITQNNPYVHTHSRKEMAMKNEGRRAHQVSATVLCNSILLFSM